MPPLSSNNRLLDNSEAPVVDLTPSQLGGSQICQSSKHSASTSTSITFSISIETVESTLHLDDYTDEEIEATWYQLDELKEIKRSRKALVKRMEAGEELDECEDCVRGLETKTKTGNRLRQSEILAASAAVLDEQDLQDEKGEVDLDMIATVYRMYTRHSQSQAESRGKADAEEASR